MIDQLTLFPEDKRPKRTRRREGCAVRQKSAWVLRVVNYFKAWLAAKPDDYTFIGEDFRVEALAAGVPDPPGHNNTWGTIWPQIRRTGLVQVTDLTRKMRVQSSNARRGRVYRKL